METKLIEIGNSKGVRIPKKLIEKYHIMDNLEIVEEDNGILIKSKKGKNKKLSWEETYKEMRNEKEDWNDFDSVISDGIK